MQLRRGRALKTLRLSNASDEVRFWQKVDKSGPCWLWTASVKPTGYGQFNRQDGTLALSHRMAYELTLGAIPEGKHLDHSCWNRRCVNPDHLVPVSNKQNSENRDPAKIRSNTGVRGVYWSAKRGRFEAGLTHNGERVNLGRFDTLSDAEVAVSEKRRQIFSNSRMDELRRMRAEALEDK